MCDRVAAPGVILLSSPVLTPDLARQARRAADQAEKEAFEERLRLRDEARTRKIAEAKLSKEELAVRTLLLGCCS